MNISLHYPYIFKNKSDEKKDNISYGMSPQILRSRMKINIWILQWKVYFFYNKKVKLGNSEMGHSQKTDGKCWSALM